MNHVFLRKWGEALHWVLFPQETHRLFVLHLYFSFSWDQWAFNVLITSVFLQQNLKRYFTQAFTRPHVLQKLLLSEGLKKDWTCYITHVAMEACFHHGIKKIIIINKGNFLSKNSVFFSLNFEFITHNSDFFFLRIQKEKLVLFLV